MLRLKYSHTDTRVLYGSIYRGSRLDIAIDGKSDHYMILSLRVVHIM